MERSSHETECSALALGTQEGLAIRSNLVHCELELGGRLIPLFSPSRQNEALLSDIQSAFTEVLRSGEYILGPQVKAFEQALATQIGYKYAVGCSSGTEALILSLKALDLPPGSEVVTPAFSFVASASSILWAGYRPVLADVDRESALITVETLDQAITPNTRAVVAVDLYGQQPDMVALRDYCATKNLFLIEDGAQSIGVENVGADFYTLSFYPTKNLGGIGDAGAILTNNESRAQKLRRLTQHGATKRDHYDEVGTNARIDTLQAAILSHKIPFIKEWTKKRREIAHFYLEALKPLQEKGKLQLPKLPTNDQSHVWALFTVQVPDHRNELVEQMKNAGVACGIYYSKALHVQKYLTAYLGDRDCPNASYLSQSVLSLPMFPELTDAERDVVVERLYSCLNTSM